MKTLFTTLTLLFFYLQSSAQCPAPVATWSSSVGTNIATLNWNAVPSATNYWVSIKLTNDTLWTTPISMNTLDTFIYLPHPLMFYPNNIPFNLNPSTSYDFAVLAECGGSIYSSYIQTQFTTTVQPCNPITNLTAATNSSTSAYINWDYPVNSSVQNFRIEYKPTNSSTWLTDSILSSGITLNNLLPSTIYDVQVKTFCTNGDSSVYSYTQFSTSCLPPDDIFITPTNSGMLNNPNGMQVWWNAQPNANSYTTDYFNNHGIYPGGGTSASTFINVCCLAPLATYYIKVRSNCASGYTSAYKSTSYSTPLWSPTLSNPIVGSTTAIFNWSNLSIGQFTFNFTAEYSELGGNWIPVPATTSPNSRNITGLIPGVDYIFRVRTNATSIYTSYSATSIWTIDTFTTQCPAPTGLIIPATNITPTSAYVDWDNISGVQYYRILFKAATPASLPWDTIVHSTTQSSYYFAPNSLSPCTFYQIKVQAKCAGGGWGDLAYNTFSTKPSAPIGINGPVVACGGQSAYFTVDTVPGASYYIWTLPSGATGFSSTHAILVSFSSTYITGNICVRAANSCGQSLQFCRSVVRLAAIPSMPGPISGLAFGVCPGTTKTYSITALPNTVSYQWIAPTNASIVSGQGTNTVTVNFASNFGTSGILKVRTVGCTANSNYRTLTINRTPATPTSITEPSPVCKNAISAFSTTNNPAFSYTWVLGGGPITSGQGTNTILVAWGNSSTGTMKVRANVSCASSPYFIKTITATNCTARMQATNGEENAIEENFFAVYPNPIYESAFIKFNSPETRHYQLMAYDVNGKIIVKKEGIANEGMNEVELSFNHFPNGMYIVKYIDEKGNTHHNKVHKQ